MRTSSSGRTRAAHPPSARGGGAARALAPLALCALALAVFWSATRNGFSGWDDTVYVVDNPWMHAPGGLRKIWTSAENEQYYPLSFTSYWLEIRLLGTSPRVFLTTNVLLHAVNTAGVWWCLRALRVPAPAAFAAAALWCVHPTHAMSVAWIAERKNLLAFAFTWIAILSWARWRDGGRRAAYAVALIAFAAALLSKTQVLGLPLALFVFDVAVARVRPWASARALAPFAVAAASAVAVTSVFERRFLDPVDPEFALPLVERVLSAAAALLAYVRLLVWPLDLAPIYPQWSVERTDLVWWLPLAVLVGAGFVAWRARARVDPRLFFGALLFVVVLAPASGVVPYGNLALTPISDHFLYAALLGPAIAAGVALEALGDPVRRRNVVLGACALVTTVEIALTRRAIPVFRDARSLWSRALERSPESYVAHLGLAESARAAGDLATARHHYRRATEIRPLWVDAYERWGAAELAAGDLDVAHEQIERALELVPQNPRAQLWSARLLERRGRPREALEACERSVRLDGAWLPSRMALGELLLGFARHADAESQFRAAVLLAPAHVRAHLGLATALRGRGDAEGAVRALEIGLAAAPRDTTLENMLALVLATARDGSVRDGARAVALARSACEATNYSDPVLVDTLAAARAEAGDARGAAASARRAAEIWRDRGDERAAQASLARAASYERGERLRL